MSAFAVPTVDIAPYLQGGDASQCERVAAEVDHAARTVGFIQIVGHGIPTSATDGLARAMDMFFAMAPDEKVAYVRPPGENRGYSPPKSESLSYSLGIDPVTKMNDFFEAFNVGTSTADDAPAGIDKAHYAANTWPIIDGAQAQFQVPVCAYFDHAQLVAHVLTRIFADAIGLEPDYFEAMTGHSIDVLRMNNYALPPGEIELGADLTGMGEHTDFGIVTLLWADQVEGLQVLADDAWHDVQPADGAILVNLGDAMARLTNDEWRSTLHRVVPPVVNGQIKRRRSAAFFHDGDADAVIGPIPVFLAGGRPAHYEPVTNAEHIAAKLNGSRAGIRNPHTLREAARVRAAAQ